MQNCKDGNGRRVDGGNIVNFSCLTQRSLNLQGLQFHH